MAPTPRGFTVGELAAKVQEIGGQAFRDYGVRQAAYDLRKLRAKQLVEKPGHSRRYQVLDHGLRTITALVVTGIATNICVESTIRDAFYRDYAVVVPREATASFTEEAEAGSFANFGFAFARVLPLEDVVDQLETVQKANGAMVRVVDLLDPGRPGVAARLAELSGEPAGPQATAPPAAVTPFVRRRRCR